MAMVGGGESVMEAYLFDLGAVSEGIEVRVVDGEVGASIH